MSDGLDESIISFEPDKYRQDQSASKLRSAIFKYVAIYIMMLTTIWMTVDVIYRVSEARTAIWPAPLSKREFVFDEPDPVLREFVRVGFCESQSRRDSDKKCMFVRALANDKQVEALRLLEHAKVDELEYAKQVLLDQIADAALRRDWATCAAYAKFSIRLLNEKYDKPSGSSELNNKLLLMSAACEDPIEVYENQSFYVDLILQMIQGKHLEYHIKDVAGNQFAMGGYWKSYLDGLSLIRRSKFDEASESFLLVRAEGGFLRELAVVGLARSVFWKFKTAPVEKVSYALKKTTIKRLNDAKLKCNSPMACNDIDYYIREASK